jgi:hypothetical protein
MVLFDNLPSRCQSCFAQIVAEPKPGAPGPPTDDSVVSDFTLEPDDSHCPRAAEYFHIAGAAITQARVRRITCLINGTQHTIWQREWSTRDLSGILNKNQEFREMRRTQLRH